MADKYIKREDAVIKAKQAVFAAFRYGKTPTENAVYEHIDIAFKEQYSPSADVVEVRHGEWIDKTMSVPSSHGQTYGRYGCSVCKNKVRYKSNFCPNCGARMDG